VVTAEFNLLLYSSCRVRGWETVKEFATMKGRTYSLRRERLSN
jgi:hypothetical protein